MNFVRDPSRSMKRMTIVSNLFLLLVVIGFVALIFDKLSTASHSLDTIDISRQLRSDDDPEVAWLISFPNSGTTYTQRVVQETTMTTVATFYGSEFLDRFGRGRFVTNTKPLFDGQWEGPFPLSNLDVPKGGYVLTKTHCGGYCFSSACQPRGYILSSERFLGECIHGARMEPRNNDLGYERIWFHYDPSIAKRAVHLFRNPFDNIISRFHHEVHMNKNKSPHITWTEKFINNQEGFKRWCHVTDTRNFAKETRLLHGGIMKTFENVPCHGEFFRYVQWHNNAFSVTESLGIPTHVVYYEDYDRDITKTIHDLLDFLGRSWIQDPPKFQIKTYEGEGYYTDDEKQHVFRMFQELASVQTLQYLKYYMTDH